MLLSNQVHFLSRITFKITCFFLLVFSIPFQPFNFIFAMVVLQYGLLPSHQKYLQYYTSWELKSFNKCSNIAAMLSYLNRVFMEVGRLNCMFVCLFVCLGVFLGEGGACPSFHLSRRHFCPIYVLGNLFSVANIMRNLEK